MAESVKYDIFNGAQRVIKSEGLEVLLKDANKSNCCWNSNAD